MTIWFEHGDMREVMRRLIDEKIAVDAIVTDPPYHLTTGKKGGSGEASLNPNSPAGRSVISTGFMGKQWDGGDIAFQADTWRLCYEILPPGGHLLAFGGTRTFHRLVCAIEDAGFEIRESLLWLYGTGFPKSLDVSKAIVKEAGATRNVLGTDSNFGRTRLADGKNVFGDYAGTWVTTAPVTDAARQWQGWGTALKPACELICLARKPLIGTVAANVQAHGTGALNIDGCRVPANSVHDDPRLNGKGSWQTGKMAKSAYGEFAGRETGSSEQGRWPANVCHDGSDEVVEMFPAAGGASAARFFYSSKASSKERRDSKHPTVKPVKLMQWLVRLITPPNGMVLDPFAGTGTTGEACKLEGFDCTLIERETEYAADIRKRIPDIQVET